ncbi:AzlD domain-containing protein [Bacillus shivajii]|uniref:AzlD domain-containing protein n=1 Tax=Bacillus shivajii TaxID=1983719 RepID=UPI001CFB2E70|nr:AzlD domain-containing protein [Bacillus shivajii]UCZ52002.1 AzlD domain-containing protein [Bacillus shivajii]
MNMTIVLMIIGMGIVTYIPRMMPLVMLQTESWPTWSKRMLSRVPYAVLGALIFPGILTFHENIWFAMTGALMAIILAYVGAPLILVVGGAIGGLAVVTYLF